MKNNVGKEIARMVNVKATYVIIHFFKLSEASFLKFNIKMN